MWCCGRTTTSGAVGREWWTYKTVCTNILFHVSTFITETVFCDDCTFYDLHKKYIRGTEAFLAATTTIRFLAVVPNLDITWMKIKTISPAKSLQQGLDGSEDWTVPRVPRQERCREIHGDEDYLDGNLKTGEHSLGPFIVNLTGTRIIQKIFSHPDDRSHHSEPGHWLHHGVWR